MSGDVCVRTAERCEGVGSLESCEGVGSLEDRYRGVSTAVPPTKYERESARWVGELSPRTRCKPLDG